MSANSQDAILQLFKRNLIDFLNELIEQFPSETKFILARLFVKDTMTAEQCMEHFITGVIPMKTYIRNRDEIFFLQTNEITNYEANQHIIQSVRDLWTSANLDAEDKEIIWNWFDFFLNLAEKYIAESKNT